MLKKNIEIANNENEILNPNIEYGDLNAKMKMNSNLKLARYSTNITNKLTKNKVYNSIYYLTANSYSLVVYEFSEDESSIENYLWTTKT